MDCLHAFTVAGAEMEFMEGRKGILKAGYLADVVVLDSDLENIKPNKMTHVKPVMTVCDGRVVWEG